MAKMDMLSRPGAPIRAAESPVEGALALVREQLDRIRFGSIALSIHDGRVVQLEIVEKKRLA